MPLTNINDFYKEMGERIKTERLKKNINQEELGDYLDLTRTSIINLEKGRHRPSVFQLLQIAELFEIDHTVLMPDPKREKSKRTKTSIKNMDNMITDQEKIDKTTKAAVLNFLTNINKD
jgi:transcriptional regulator with XRE-family HTH domain